VVDVSLRWQPSRGKMVVGLRASRLQSILHHPPPPEPPPEQQQQQQRQEEGEDQRMVVAAAPASRSGEQEVLEEEERALQHEHIEVLVIARVVQVSDGRVRVSLGKANVTKVGARGEVLGTRTASISTDAVSHWIAPMQRRPSANFPGAMPAPTSTSLIVSHRGEPMPPWWWHGMDGMIGCCGRRQKPRAPAPPSPSQREGHGEGTAVAARAAQPPWALPSLQMPPSPFGTPLISRLLERYHLLPAPGRSPTPQK
jgi:hypothetical protein